MQFNLQIIVISFIVLISSSYALDSSRLHFTGSKIAIRGIARNFHIPRPHISLRPDLRCSKTSTLEKAIDLLSSLLESPEKLGAKASSWILPDKFLLPGTIVLTGIAVSLAIHFSHGSLNSQIKDSSSSLNFRIKEFSSAITVAGLIAGVAGGAIACSVLVLSAVVWNKK
jgi:hypothetical protein